MYNCIIVDDEIMFCKKMSEYIKKHPKFGFDVVSTFYDGEEAIEYLKTSVVDLIITDIQMRKCSGIDIARYVFESNCKTDLIIISAYSEFTYAQQAVSYNVLEYLTKPLDFEKLNNSLIKAYNSIKNKPLYQTPIPPIIKNALDTNNNSVINLKKEIIENAKNYINSNYNTDLSLQQIADYVYLSPVYFCRIFSECVGESFLNYLTRIRMENAVELIKQKVKIDDIAIMVGYSSGKYFSRAFKKYTGYTPSDYYRIINIK